jgi:hypothetical protein
VVAARGRDHAYRRDLALQQVVERAARLERARMLQELELEHEAHAGEAKVRPIHLEHGSSAHVRGDAVCGCGNGRRVERGSVHFAQFTGCAPAQWRVMLPPGGATAMMDCSVRTSAGFTRW